MNYYLIPKISISYALMVGRIAMWEYNQKLCVGKVSRITNSRNIVVSVDGQDVFIGGSNKRRACIVVSEKELEEFSEDGHRKGPTMDDRLCVWSSYPEGQSVELLMALFPNTWQQVRDKFRQMIVH